jgi:copper chaperone CopZ
MVGFGGRFHAQRANLAQAGPPGTGGVRTVRPIRSGIALRAGAFHPPMRIFLAALCFFTALAASAETFSFTVIGIDCAACAPPIVKALNGVDGVTNPRIDTKKSIATVDIPAGFDKDRIRTAVTASGFGVVFPGEQPKNGIDGLPEEIVRTLDIKSDTSGQRVEIARLLVPGKITIVDFYADWCGPCRVLENRIEHLMAGGRKDLAVRRLNIGKWDNALAKQATHEFRLAALPYIRVYDAEGRFVTEVTGGMWDEVLGAIDKASDKASEKAARK